MQPKSIDLLVENDLALIFLLLFQHPDEIDENGVTAMHYAASNGNLDCLKLLVERGGDVNKEDISCCTPLHLAARNGHLLCVEYLCRNGANVQAKSAKGNTPKKMAKLNFHNHVANYVGRLGKLMLLTYDQHQTIPRNL